MLNGRPYYLRGSNITIYRFFEDAARADLPWRQEWVRSLHRQIKSIHWNSLRYCIGFPPESWYDIADEEGLLIQDEFPIWLLGAEWRHDPSEPDRREDRPGIHRMDAGTMEPSMRRHLGRPERKLHAGDGKAIQAVRKLDLSNRPWDNGWAEPQADTDSWNRTLHVHSHLERRQTLRSQ